MRVNGHWAQRARELVNELFPSDVVLGLSEHPMMPEPLRALVDGVRDPDEGDSAYERIHFALAGCVAPALMAADHGRQQGMETSFMSEVNMLRSGFVSADLTNFEGYQQLFPEVVEQYGPDDGQLVLGGLRSHLIGLFADQGNAEQAMARVINMVIERSAHFEGQVAGREVAVANDGEITVEHVLNAADAMMRVTEASGIPFEAGVGMILRGQCEFVGGQAALRQYVGQAYPGAGPAELASVCDRVEAYMRQLDGELVNGIIREIGGEWLANEAAEYLAQAQAEAREYDDEQEQDFDEEELYDAPQLGVDDLSFRM